MLGSGDTFGDINSSHSVDQRDELTSEFLKSEDEAIRSDSHTRMNQHLS